MLWHQQVVRLIVKFRPSELFWNHNVTLKATVNILHRIHGGSVQEPMSRDPQWMLRPQCEWSQPPLLYSMYSANETNYLIKPFHAPINRKHLYFLLHISGNWCSQSFSTCSSLVQGSAQMQTGIKCLLWPQVAVHLDMLFLSSTHRSNGFTEHAHTQ